MTFPTPPVQPGSTAIRQLGKRARNSFTATLQPRIGKHDYGWLTNAEYTAYFGTDAAGLRRAFGLPPKANVRDSLPDDALAALALIETTAVKCIVASNCNDPDACAIALIRCATNVRQAVQKSVGPLPPSPANDALRVTRRAA